MVIETATIYALAALFFTVVTVMVYFVIFFAMMFGIFWTFAAILRPIFRAIK